MSLTVLSETIQEKEVLHSHFIASIRHIENEEDFAKHLKDIKESYPKADHYCYGARFKTIEKMGDDGEPGHSAGLQILSTLRHKNLDDVSIIVVRYFGGTKLGLPRLTRTYRDCAEEVIQKSKIVEAKPGIKVTIKASYSELDSIKYQLAKEGFQLGTIDYGEEISLSFSGEEISINKYLEKFDPKKIKDRINTVLYSEVIL